MTDPTNRETEVQVESEDVRERVWALLATHTTMTLATTGPDGAPAAAAVFYAADEAFNLYFLSEEQTRHGQNMASNPGVAATIQADRQDWRAITGLQVRGQAGPVSPADLPRAAAVYAQKYAFVAGLLAGAAGPATLSGPLARARFYVLRPEWVRLVDNNIRFGYKVELSL